MATAEEQRSRNNGHNAGAAYLLTPAAELAALRDPTAGVDLMDRHQLNRFESESRRIVKKGISHFLSPQLQVLVKEKPRIVLSEKADFAEMLSEEPSGRRIQELSMDLLRQSFMIRKRVVTAGVAADEHQEGGRNAVPPDVSMAHQTTNKFSPAFAVKVKAYTLVSIVWPTCGVLAVWSIRLECPICRLQDVHAAPHGQQQYNSMSRTYWYTSTGGCALLQV